MIHNQDENDIVPLESEVQLTDGQSSPGPWRRPFTGRLRSVTPGSWNMPTSCLSLRWEPLLHSDDSASQLSERIL